MTTQQILSTIDAIIPAIGVAFLLLLLVYLLVKLPEVTGKLIARIIVHKDNELIRLRREQNRPYAATSNTFKYAGYKDIGFRTADSDNYPASDVMFEDD